MLADSALLKLQRGLALALDSMSIASSKFGAPQLVEASSKAAEKMFQGYARAMPSKEDAYAAALAFMRGLTLDFRQKDLIASALAEPIREQAGAQSLGSERLGTLLNFYEVEASEGRLWRLTWYALMSSYFAFDTKKSTIGEQSGWKQLRVILERTWPMVDRETGTANIPDWVKVLRQESALLTENPTAKYAREYLVGNQDAVKRLSTDLGISQSSWFWHSLVLSAVHSAASSNDLAFRKLIPRLIELVEERPAYRDEAVEAILIRYHSCKEAPLDENLRNYVVRKDVWRNPKLKSAGIATAWNRVPDPVWQMVLGWVNERNLKDFFDILAARNQADEGRLAFWSKYMKQISWTRLVFGAETIGLKNRNPEIRDLIAREEGSFATLTANQTVDAFMMGIGEFIIVEFSKKPNAAYVYRASSMKFDRNSRYYSGGTDDLKYGFHDKNELRITHPPGWQHEATAGMKRLGISPDRQSAQRVAASTAMRAAPPTLQNRTSSSTRSTAHIMAEPVLVDGAPAGASFTMKELNLLVNRFPKAYIKDSRVSSGGRLWVEDPINRSQLAAELKTYGFKWANTRSAWYYMEH